MYEMKEEYLIGIEQIDKEHEKLFEIAEKVYQLLQDKFIPDKYDNIRQVLIELREYTIMHFEHEEEYMKSIQYKRMFTQKVEHDAFRKKIEDLEFEKLDEKQEEMIKEILEFLTNWLVHHILETDKLIGQ
ncbi:bacteriohemerythrin [Anaerosacchariphilus polymeriproducens]|uniref:Bacteriohemerythrin n=1 Tax=Anaerosacchariphilus polymeriproducens TaxID=1812858 RepID=A0A371ATL8_9FIRM|nr:hemerythrin family protein [Anaerosacchariphilus polymeriproducens]RDU22882.1 bacteriohemerythrin [Anaerosacchariphilus polymeriproducens]